jgi:hypothetical protein
LTCYCSFKDVSEKTHTKLEEKKHTISQQNEQLIVLWKKVADLEGTTVQPLQEEQGMIMLTEHAEKKAILKQLLSELEAEKKTLEVKLQNIAMQQAQ